MWPAKYTIPGLVGLALLLASLGAWGCASKDGRPTITLDAEYFVAAYMAERDDFRDRTFLARLTCAQGKAQDPSLCDTLKAAQTIWSTRDAAVLKALLTRSPIDPATIQAAANAGKDLLGIAVKIAPLLGLAI
jgi:hypothetical protein